MFAQVPIPTSIHKPPQNVAHNKGANANATSIRLFWVTILHILPARLAARAGAGTSCARCYAGAVHELAIHFSVQRMRISSQSGSEQRPPTNLADHFALQETLTRDNRYSANSAKMHCGRPDFLFLSSDYVALLQSTR